jgi:hypothetical protein
MTGKTPELHGLQAIGTMEATVLASWLALSGAWRKTLEGASRLSAAAAVESQSLEMTAVSAEK